MSRALRARGLIGFAGVPTEIVQGGSGPVTNAAEPTAAPSPSAEPGKMVECAPMMQCRSINTAACCTFVNLDGIVGFVIYLPE